MSPSLAATMFSDPSLIFRLAGLSGAMAVGLGAYGAHGLRSRKEVDAKRLHSYDQGSRYHLIHSLALLAALHSRFPALTTALLLLGIVVFCGSCYYYGLTGDRSFIKSTPFGGVTLVVAWLTFVL
ncbi:unnamed protein product [Anisakis simplex]|uniref:Transmembrane protein 256 homolog n=1 Tax=Anisakis simplex TaxID=6269 RepID=A0A0M3IZE2_ANISI|nr:unnamed protein product [Anisakis simplex]